MNVTVLIACKWYVLITAASSCVFILSSFSFFYNLSKKVKLSTALYHDKDPHNSIFSPATQEKIEYHKTFYSSYDSIFDSSKSHELKKWNIDKHT